MGIEGGGRWEIPRPRTEINEEVFRHPEEVFDSPQREARKSSELVMNRLSQREISYRGRDVQFFTEREGGSKAPSIQIAWPVSDKSAYLLELQPLQEGRGPEAGVVAYRGAYGTGRKKGTEWRFKSQVSLEQLFGMPPGIEVYVKPSVDRWAIGKDELADIFGNNARTLYMGLGLLLLGHQWMLVGMHEAGHLPNSPDENEAWFKANSLYADYNRKDKTRIVKGGSTGLFELLERPGEKTQNPQPTIGKIMQYGLVSHYIGGTKIPKHWVPKAPDIMQEFRQVIKQAHNAYAKVVS